jgi:PAS domain S-box-containing protein
VDARASLLAQPSRAHKAAAVVAALAIAWVVDSSMDTLLRGDPFAEEFLRPGPVELYVRIVLAALLLLLYRQTLNARRMHLLSSALAAAPDGIQITSLDGLVQYSNPAVRDIYGYSPEELHGRHVNEMNADPHFASQVILPALAREGRWAGELEVKHKDGHVFTIWLSTSAVVGAGGRPLAAIGVIRDITQRKRAEEELRSYARRLEDATELKELFADILRHDLLGPAATVHLSIDSLLKRDPPPELARKMLGNAQRACTKLIAMIEGAAKYARLSAAADLDFATLDLGPVLREVVSEAEVRGGERCPRVVLDAAGSYPVRANPTIADVFENLVSNAMKYGRGDGEVRVTVSDEGRRWRVSVADRGEGIPDEDKQKLFTRFERLRKEGVKGTGLGLAIAKRIVDLHGGSIWVEDNPGGGSVFCVALDKAPPP